MSTLSTLLSQPPYSDVYPERPIWALYASNGPTSGYYMTFGPNPYVPIGFEQMGGSTNAVTWKIRPTNDEIANSGIYFQGSATTVPGVSTYSPATGVWGASQFGQTACTAHFDAFSNGVWGSYNGAASIGNLNYGGTVIGESNFCQTFDFFNNSGYVGVDPIGGGFAYFNDSTSVDSKVTLSSVSGWQSHASNILTSTGMLSYNRTTNKIAILSANGAGTTGYGFRLHVVTLSAPVGQNTSNAMLSSMFLAAVAAGSPTYKYYDVTFPADCTNPTSAETRYNIKIVLCNDDTMWFVRNDVPAAGGVGTMRLYKIATAVTAGTTGGTLAPTAVTTLSSGASTVYGFDTNPQYGMRHMNSDDNSRIIVYAPYSSYCSGMRVFALSTATAAGATAPFITYSDADTALGYSVCPVGGKRFGFCKSGNIDFVGVQMYFLDTTVLDGTSKTIGSPASQIYPVPSKTAWYGGVIALKVQPMREFK